MHATPEPQCVMDANIVHVLDLDTDFGTQEEQAVKRPRYSRHFALEFHEFWAEFLVSLSAIV